MTVQKIRSKKSAHHNQATHPPTPAAGTTAAAVDVNATTTTTDTNQEPNTMKTLSNTTIATNTHTSSTSAASVPNAGLASIVQEVTAALDSAESKLGPEPVITTSSAKRRITKPRKGSDKALAQLAPIVKQYGLDSASLSTDEMLARQGIAQTLLPLQLRLKKMSKRVDDQVFGAETGAWEMGLQFYSLLKRRGKSDGNVATTIAPLEAAFAYRHPSVKASKVTVRAKSDLKKTLALAKKHGVSVQLAPDGTAEVFTGPPGAVVAAQAEAASLGIAPAAANTGGAVTSVSGATAPVASVAAAPVEPVAPVATPGGTPAAAAPATNGAATVIGH